MRQFLARYLKLLAACNVGAWHQRRWPRSERLPHTELNAALVDLRLTLPSDEQEYSFQFHFAKHTTQPLVVRVAANNAFSTTGTLATHARARIMHF